MVSIEHLLNDEQRMLRDTVRKFASEEVAPRAAQIDRDDEFPREVYLRMGELGLLSLLIPPQAGGAGADMLSQALVQEELARVSAVTANWQVKPNESGPFLFKYGHPDLVARYLSRVMSGEVIPAFGLTEPTGGSDAAAIRTTAERQGDEFVINGSKQFISGGLLADYVVVIAVTDRSKGSRGISAILVERGTPGFSVGKKEDLVGMRGLAVAGMHFDDCRVPAFHLMGEEGRGLRMSLDSIDSGRISTAAMAVGIAQAALDAALAYAQRRVQFGKPIFEFQAISFMLADMATQVDAARLLYLHAAALRDRGERASLAASEAKLFATDMAERVTSSAIQIFGGYGYTKEYPVERYWRDARLSQIYEGTNQIQRIVIARELVRNLAR